METGADCTARPAAHYRRYTQRVTMETGADCTARAPAHYRRYTLRVSYHGDRSGLHSQARSTLPAIHTEG